MARTMPERRKRLRPNPVMAGFCPGHHSPVSGSVQQVLPIVAPRHDGQNAVRLHYFDSDSRPPNAELAVIGCEVFGGQLRAFPVPALTHQ